MYPTYYPLYRIPYCPMIYSGFPMPYETEVSEEIKDYRDAEENIQEIEERRKTTTEQPVGAGLTWMRGEAPETSGQSPMGMKNHEEKEGVYKVQFVSGFVPLHNHGSVDYTSIADGHVHQCLDVTHPPTISKDGTHVHYTEGYVLFEDGHNHYYKAWSGPAIPVGNGMHVHYYDFYTTENDGHRHRITGVDMPAPGTL